MKSIETIENTRIGIQMASILMLMAVCMPVVISAEGTQAAYPPVNFESNLKENPGAGQGAPRTMTTPQKPGASTGVLKNPKHAIKPLVPYNSRAPLPRRYLPQPAKIPRYPVQTYVPNTRQMPAYVPRQYFNPLQRPAVPYPGYQPNPYATYKRYPVPARPMGYPAPVVNYPRAPVYGNRYAPRPNANNYKRSAPSQSMTDAYASNTNKVYPMRKKIKKEVHAWGDERHIWPDFYTDLTNDWWDSMINGPYDMGRMPGGWRAPSLSSPDPVTIGDAVTNQLPPMAEEAGNMTNFSN